MYEPNFEKKTLLNLVILNIIMYNCALIRLNGPWREKTSLPGFANNTGEDQPGHLPSLISAFVIRFVESIVCKLATDEISIFWLVLVAEETGLKLALLETPKTGFVATRPKYCALLLYVILDQSKRMLHVIMDGIATEKRLFLTKDVKMLKNVQLNADFKQITLEAKSVNQLLIPFYISRSH